MSLLPACGLPTSDMIILGVKGIAVKLKISYGRHLCSDSCAFSIFEYVCATLLYIVLELD